MKVSSFASMTPPSAYKMAEPRFQGHNPRPRPNITDLDRLRNENDDLHDLPLETFREWSRYAQANNLPYMPAIAGRVISGIGKRPAQDGAAVLITVLRGLGDNKQRIDEVLNALAKVIKKLPSKERTPVLLKALQPSPTPRNYSDYMWESEWFKRSAALYQLFTQPINDPAATQGDLQVFQAAVTEFNDTALPNTPPLFLLDQVLLSLRLEQDVSQEERDQALISAVLRKEPKSVDTMLQAGANANAVDWATSSYYAHSFSYKKSPLNAAIDRRDLNAVKKLIETAGADINLPDGDGYTPLMQAVYANDKTIFNYLRTKGADAAAEGETIDGNVLNAIVALNNDGWYAIAKGLLEEGVDPSVPDFSGKTANIRAEIRVSQQRSASQAPNRLSLLFAEFRFIPDTGSAHP